MRYKLVLSYNGTNYNGWQKQKNANTVQQCIEDKMSLLLQVPIEILGCGRTDTGVHAKNYVAHFDCEKPLLDNFSIRLNSVLPNDISIEEITEIDSEFHARFDATLRTYEYHISHKKNPFNFDCSWYYLPKPDIDNMNAAVRHLIGQKEFQCFCKGVPQFENYKCTVTQAEWVYLNENELVFTISANRFLRNMVRSIVGTLLDIGFGKISESDFINILASKNRSEAGASVPARGLTLVQVEY